MKKSLYIVIVCFTILSLSAKENVNLNQEQNALVYSLPQTEFCIEIEIEKTTQKTGVYNQYAQRYLATDQIILEDKTNYILKNIQIGSRVVADANRTYILQLEENILSQICVNSNGILSGINVQNTLENYKIPSTNKIFNEKADEATLLPLGEEYMMAGSNAKLAEGAAKQIYRLRESRVSLLTGDLEKLPSDGKSLSTMLEGLDKMEKQLTELFVGKTKTEVIRKTIFLIPDSINTKQQVLFRLSSQKGLVTSTDLSGKPYFIIFSPEKPILKPADYSLKNNKNLSINTILPALTNLNITDGVKSIYSNNILIPQFGVVIPLSIEELAKQKTKVQIDTTTGRILSIEKTTDKKGK